MIDYFEVDFLDVEADRSGDAITIRYHLAGQTFIHVVDGGFQSTGASVCKHIATCYDNPSFIDHVVLTHPDGDHAGGLRDVLETYDIGALWMLRPWMFAKELMPSFPSVRSERSLVDLLREAYPNVAALEEIALRRGIPIADPFQGSSIGAFQVLAPSKRRYLELVVKSDCTPRAASHGLLDETFRGLKTAVARAVALVRAAWGDENFSEDAVSTENEMSVVQFARLVEQSILLTGDVGREGLGEAIAFAPSVGLWLPGIDRFQVPHHGSRRNLSTRLLDDLLGPRLAAPCPTARFHAFISSAKKDEDHPRKVVLRAIVHRGGEARATEGGSIRTSANAPPRDGWVAMPPLPYPDEQEE